MVRFWEEGPRFWEEGPRYLNVALVTFGSWIGATTMIAFLVLLMGQMGKGAIQQDQNLHPFENSFSPINIPRPPER